MVVATLWPVDDAVTAALIESFYRELSSGRTVAGALARARHEIARDPRTAHPFYWAGFIAVGAGEVTIPLLRRVMPPSYAVAALALAVGWCFFLILASWGRAGRLTGPGSRS